jgi:hypothetical protein
MSELFKLNLNDFTKGLLIATITGALTVIYSAFNSACGVGCIDWTAVVNAGVGAGIAYLIKNYLSDSEGKFAGVL